MYEKMWNKLKEKITADLHFHSSGEMQSLAEAHHCEIKCKEILAFMSQLEENQKK